MSPNKSVTLCISVLILAGCGGTTPEIELTPPPGSRIYAPDIDDIINVTGAGAEVLATVAAFETINTTRIASTSLPSGNATFTGDLALIETAGQTTTATYNADLTLAMDVTNGTFLGTADNFVGRTPAGAAVTVTATGIGPVTTASPGLVVSGALGSTGPASIVGRIQGGLTINGTPSDYFASLSGTFAGNTARDAIGSVSGFIDSGDLDGVFVASQN